MSDADAEYRVGGKELGVFSVKISDAYNEKRSIRTKAQIRSSDHSLIKAENEKEAVLLVENITKNTTRSRDGVFDHVSEDFSEAEIIKLIMISAYFNMNSRFIDSLKIQLEHEGEVNKTKGSGALDPERMRQYLQTILDKWSKDF